MTGFRTLGPGETKDDFGAAIGIGRLMTGRTLSPGVLARETTVELHSESACEVGISDFKKNGLVNNQRYGIVGKEEATGPWPMRTYQIEEQWSRSVRRC
jgi:hypothetical protein